MIDFNNAAFIRLNYADVNTVAAELQPLLVADEQILLAFKGIRDSVTFTNKRLIALNVQGVTGKKRDYTSLPLKKVQAFSVETAGTFDLDTELELWFSGLGKVKLEFARGVDVTGIGRLIADHAL